MELENVINKHNRVMIDTAPIIYFIEENKRFSEIFEKIINYRKSGTCFFTSVITLAEVLIQPVRNNRSDLIDRYKELLINSDDFMIYSIDPVIAEKSAELRAKYNFKTPDARQLAVGIENGATLFVTNDKELEVIKEIKVLVLKDYL